jgi:hypothetical protein
VSSKESWLAGNRQVDCAPAFLDLSSDRKPPFPSPFFLLFSIYDLLMRIARISRARSQRSSGSRALPTEWRRPRPKAFSTPSPTTATPTLHVCDAYTSLRWLCVAGSQALLRGGAESDFRAFSLYIYLVIIGFFEAFIKFASDSRFR